MRRREFKLYNCAKRFAPLTSDDPSRRWWLSRERMDRSRIRSCLCRLTHKLVSQMRSSVDRGTESDSLILNVNCDVTRNGNRRQFYSTMWPPEASLSAARNNRSTIRESAKRIGKYDFVTAIDLRSTLPAYSPIRCVLITANTSVNLLALWLWELHL